MAGTEKTQAQLQTELDAITPGMGNISWSQLDSLFDNMLASAHWGRKQTGSYAATAGAPRSIAFDTAFTAGSTVYVFVRGYDASNNPVAVKVSNVTVSTFYVEVAANCTVEWIAIKDV